MHSNCDTPVAEEWPLIDRRVLEDWCCDLDPADVADLLARVPDEGHKCLSGIKAAAACGDLPAARRMAHRLKGMAGNLGAVRLSQIARRIELGYADPELVRVQSALLEATLLATLRELAPAA